MNKRDWKIAWTLACIVVGLCVVADYDDIVEWQSRTPLWAQVLPLLSLQLPIAIGIWAVIDERAKRRKAPCED